MTTANRRKLLLDKSLVIGQIALSKSLLVAAGLFAHTLLNLNRIPLGFQADHILQFRLNLPRARYNDAQNDPLLRPAAGKAGSPAGVSLGDGQQHRHHGQQALGIDFPRDGRARRTRIRCAFRHSAQWVWISFRRSSMPILRGRAFNAHDTGDYAEGRSGESRAGTKVFSKRESYRANIRSR